MPRSTDRLLQRHQNIACGVTMQRTCSAADCQLRRFRTSQQPCCTSPAARQNNISVCLRRCQRIAAGHGHTGQATEVNTTDESRHGRWHGTPGFLYQVVIHECSACSAPINDGSERLYTRDAEAPVGQYRYTCESCGDFHLCEACWDRCALLATIAWCFIDLHIQDRHSLSACDHCVLV